MNKYPSAHIITSTTTQIIARSCSILALAIVVGNAGTTWTLNVRNKEGTPKSIYLNDGTGVTVGAKYFDFPSGFMMRGGIEIVTVGTPGVADVHFVLAGAEAQ